MDEKKEIISGEVNDGINLEENILVKKEEHHSRHNGHHHGDHHHRHHHRHRNKEQNVSGKKRKFIAFVEKYRKQLWIISAIAILAILLIILAIFVDSRNKYGSDAAKGDTMGVTNQSIQLEVPLFTEEISLVSPAITDFLDPENTDTVSEVYKEHRSAGRNDTAVPVTLSYKVNGMPNECEIASSVIEVSENDAFSSPLVFNLEKDQNGADVYFLKTNTKYYYRITITLSDDQTLSTQGTFVTADTPRTLKIDGVVNARDIGGWSAAGGKRIKQGLLYRGSELDGAVEAKFCITPKGVNDMVNVLGIKSDFDLRAPEENKNGIDALGSNVKHTYYSVPMYSSIFNNAQKEAVRKVFSELADKSNYPVYLHCTRGLDRTGTICYLLEALLGVSDEDLMREYELSAMYHGGVNDKEMSDFIENISYLAGETTGQKVEGYLLSIGVTAEEISNIREIFLGN